MQKIKMQNNTLNYDTEKELKLSLKNRKKLIAFYIEKIWFDAYSLMDLYHGHFEDEKIGDILKAIEDEFCNQIDQIDFKNFDPIGDAWENIDPTEKRTKKNILEHFIKFQSLKNKGV